MLKLDFVKAIAAKSGLTQTDVLKFLDAQEKVVFDVVKSEDSVTIPGIGTVKCKIVPERTGKVNMGAKKGETWTKPKHKKGTIKIASSLKNIFSE